MSDKNRKDSRLQQIVEDHQDFNAARHYTEQTPEYLFGKLAVKNTVSFPR